MSKDLRYIESLIDDIEYTSCPTNDIFANFIDNNLTGESKDNVMEHLTHCYQCREVLNEVIEYKKKSKPFNKIIFTTPILAIVASLIIFVYIPSDAEIGMIDISKISMEFRANESTMDKIVNGDKFIKNITEKIVISNLKIFNQAKKESTFDTSIELYQEAINTIPEDLEERKRLKETIFIQYQILKLATNENNKLAIESYKSIIRENIRDYYLLE